MSKHNLVTGIDIGGSHITAGLIDMENRAVADNFIVRRRVDSHATADKILSGWCAAIQELWQQKNIASAPLGFAMPGPFNYENGICLIKGLDKYESLYEMNIRTAIAERLGMNEEDIRFRNDAEAFLEGELFCGSAIGFTQAIGITLGTGLGSACSHDGITADAELSMMQYQEEIIEEDVSTRGILRNYQRLSGRKLKDAKAVAELYDTDADARKAFQLFGNDLSWFLEYFIGKEKPEVLVIGGNIVQSWDLFMHDVISQLSAALPILPKVVKAGLGENAALIGAACCFNQPGIEMAGIENEIRMNYSTIAKTP